MHIACLSGWGQPADALASIIPPSATSITHIDYARHESANAALLHIAEKAKGCDMVVGWSLGGQLALRAIASGIFHPSRLVLIAAPFQFVKNAALPLGMPRDLFEKFRDNYDKTPLATLKKAWELISKDDSNAQTVRNHLLATDKEELLTKNWGNWLQILENFTCKDLYTAESPPTLLIHGDRDLVVYPEQSEKMLTILPRARLETFPGCGHAPHWHDAARVQSLITAHAHV